jgi:hypothetical protein
MPYGPWLVAGGWWLVLAASGEWRVDKGHCLGQERSWRRRSSMDADDAENAQMTLKKRAATTF